VTGVEIKPGIYLAHVAGIRQMVAVVLGPNRRPVMIPIDSSAIVTEIVEDNWRGLDIVLTPLYAQGGLSGAMYWDHENAINLQETADG
jgi:hypothetical protein